MFCLVPAGQQTISAVKMINEPWHSPYLSYLDSVTIMCFIWTLTQQANKTAVSTKQSSSPSGRSKSLTNRKAHIHHGHHIQESYVEGVWLTFLRELCPRVHYLSFHNDSDFIKCRIIYPQTIFLKFIFLIRPVFRVFIEFFTILFLFYVLVFWLQGMWDFSSLARDRTCTLCIGRWSFNHWTTREVSSKLFLIWLLYEVVIILGEKSYTLTFKKWIHVKLNKVK